MLEKYLGVRFNPQRIAAIGDGLNDVEVFQEAGLSIAMSNRAIPRGFYYRASR